MDRRRLLAGLLAFPVSSFVGSSGRPVLFVANEKSDVHLLCGKGLGLAYERVEVGDAEGYQNALDRLAALIDHGRNAGQRQPSN